MSENRRSKGICVTVVSVLAVLASFASPAGPGFAAEAAPASDDVDVFQPPSITPARGAGVIVDGLRSAQPGEIVTLAGDFGEKVSGFETFGQTAAGNAVRRTVKPIRIDAGSAVIKLPEGLPPHSTYLIWPKSRAGYGAPFAVNQTEVWWIGPKAARGGEPVSVFGRNLTGPGRSPRVVIRPADRDGAWRPASIVRANPFRLELIMPDLAPGEYELKAHNGRGGDLGWSQRLRFVIESGAAPASPQTFDVKTFGATGDGVQNDGPAIAAALAAAAAAAPSTLYFPPGRYLCDRALIAPSGVEWRGAGRQASTLAFSVELRTLDAPAFIHSRGEASHVTFDGLTIEADGKVGGPDGGLVSLSGSRLRFTKVKLSSWGGLTLRLAADDVTIEDSDIVGPGSFLKSSSQAFISGTTFQMTNDGESAIASWGGRDIAMTGNRLVNADESRADGHGVGRLFVAQPHLGRTRNLYFSGNETVNAAPRDCAEVDCNKGEQIILEFGGVLLRPRPVSIGPSSVTFRAQDGLEIEPGFDVVVSGGRGFGQRRRIVSAEKGKLTLDRPWDVTPDAKASRFFVTPVAERAVVYRNRFEGRRTHSQHDSNSTATLVWGLCFDVVVADNDISRMRHGVMVAATSGTKRDSVSAPFFALVEDNRISDGWNGLYTGLTFGFDTDPVVAGGVGTVFRRNDIRRMSNIGVAFDTWDTRGGDFSATVFERNQIEQVRYGVVSGLKLIWSNGAFAPTPADGTRLRQTVLHANRIDGLGSGARGAAFRSDRFQDWIDIGGTWSGFPPGDRPPRGKDRD
ncbi:glycosyl hydrolase family 28-related protein [Chenggangzhangella methanolivorans]|uniref:Glycoside hydrolase family 28 protein n=1 Tax=Chenggangzhangella methanolivorans TaxID=1437009 RepID=A0A9E6RAP8_9HYPH|nr:glycosyl hydrolase family 28-related protein [Chenggangzhangella methanolivorans]QZO01286.1 glycoside hydrolase family 28 protein [Chenggangzhangella methanolivorans]